MSFKAWSVSFVPQDERNCALDHSDCKGAALSYGDVSQFR